MAISVDLYTFAKKVNSTERPSVAAVSYNCVLEEPCGILTPRLGLNLGVAVSPHSYNYAYIAAFDRYYFIREWTYQNALWYASLEVDALASWKNTIGASTCYVLRCASMVNPAIVDTMYPGTSITTLQETVITSPWITDDLANGMFVVGIAGQSTTYYLLTYAALDYLFDYMFSDVYAAALVGSEWLSLYPELKAQTNPLQYITSIMWIPIVATGTAVETIRIGWVDIPISACWKVDGSGIVAGEHEFTIINHPQAARGYYLNGAPYSNYTMFFPPWGTIPLDPDTMANSETVTALWMMDLRTGGGTLAIFGGTQHLMSITHAQIGVSYQVSQVKHQAYGGLQLLAPALSTAANIVTGNFAGVASTVAGAIGNAAAAKIPSATTIGSNGGINALRGAPALQYEFKEVVDDDNAHKGAPLCQNVQIGTLSGYVQVSNAYINIAATQEERAAIIGFMEAGFFYE